MNHEPEGQQARLAPLNTLTVFETPKLVVYHYKHLDRSMSVALFGLQNEHRDCCLPYDVLMRKLSSTATESPFLSSAAPYRYISSNGETMLADFERFFACHRSLQF